MNNNYPQPDQFGQRGEGSPYYNQGSADEYSQPTERGRKPYQFPGGNRAQPVNNTDPTSYRPYEQNDVPVYQATQPARPFANAPVPGGRPNGGPPPRRRRPRRKGGCLIGCLSVLAIFLVVFIFLFIGFQKAMAFGSAISQQSPLSTQTNFVSGSSRINFLLMGYGGSGHDGAYLTDSMVIISLIPDTHHTTLISVPRDLWVQNPANSGSYTKLNAVYPVAAGDQNQNPLAGGNATAQKISLITGLQVNYWMTINFAGFKDFIDAIGGVDVNVPDAFTARYPANDDPSINPNWLTVAFTKGQQHMDGQRAIIYARARYVLDNNAEGSDFARSQRQQLIMKAALAKLKDWHTWPQFYGATDKLEKTIYTNFSLADLAEFALKMDLNSAHRVGLSNANVLTDTTSSDGQSILLPQNGNWSLIPTFIQKQLYS